MAIVPSINDENRETELRRMKGEPETFNNVNLENGVVESKIEKLVAIIEEMDQEDPIQFTKKGLPQLAFLSDVLETDVSAEERDAAWTAYLASIEG